jgi:hypothetical protein
LVTLSVDRNDVLDIANTTKVKASHDPTIGGIDITAPRPNHCRESDRATAARPPLD